jgi:hypothetical protein
MTKKDGPAAIALAQRAQALLADCPEAQPSDEFECWRSQNCWLDMLSMAEQIGDPETHAAEEVLLALAGQRCSFPKPASGSSWPPAKRSICRRALHTNK